MVTEYRVDPDKAFNRAVKEAAAQVADLTIPLTLISKSWFQSNRFIFEVKGGPGKYEDLSERYKERKQALAGFIYPVLKRSGALAKSITDPTDGDAISLILNRKTLVLGTKVPYAGYHHTGTNRMPARPPVLIGAEQSAPAQLNKRQELWIETLQNYVLQVAGKAFDK